MECVDCLVENDVGNDMYTDGLIEFGHELLACSHQVATEWCRVDIDVELLVRDVCGLALCGYLLAYHFGPGGYEAVLIKWRLEHVEP